MGEENITPINVKNQIEECYKCVELKMWPQYKVLFKKIKNFITKEYSNKTEEDEIIRYWLALRAVSVDAKLTLIQDVTNFDDYLSLMKDIAEIVNDPQHLWDIMHSEVQTVFRATPSQARIIATTFFKPQELFDFGLDSFLASSLCDTSFVECEEDVIDLFYAACGYVKTCGLEKGAKTPQKFADFIGVILKKFLSIPGFTPERFVWLVEMCNEHLFIDPNVLRALCSDAISEFAQQNLPPEEKLAIAGIISTSPFMTQLPVLRSTIDQEFQAVVQDHRTFVRKYILPGFADISWNTETVSQRPSDPLVCWKIYANNLRKQGKSITPIEQQIFTIFVWDSISLVFSIYGDIQTTQQKSIDLRRDIFYFCREIENINVQLSSEAKQKLWMMLLIAAISGATKELLDQTPNNVKSDESIFLGLKIDKKGENFNDYKLALDILRTKFANESDNYPYLLKFIRSNY